MRPKALLFTLPALLALAACTDSGRLKNPFHPEAPFSASAVPADFAIMVDENHDTYYSRQHIAQTITASNAMSKTTYTTFRDYNNSVSNKFSQETPVSPTQLQNMWNDVSRYNLLDRSTLWVNWLSAADLFKRDTYTVQIRANGKTRSYRETNGFAGPVRPLVYEIQALRLHVSQNSATPVIPTTPETRPEPSTQSTPATNPATPDMAPLTPSPATQSVFPALPETPSPSTTTTKPSSNLDDVLK